MDFSSIPWNLVVEALGFSLGLLYLWFEYNANSHLWIVSMVMPLISMWIYFSKGLYADFSLSLYYLVIAVYGYVVWTRNRHSGRRQGENTEKSDHADLPISHTPRAVVAGCALCALLLWGALFLVLEFFTDSTVPVADAFTTALSIVAMWMLARKYIEQWLVWVVVDAVSSCLYFYKGIYFYCVLYVIYTVIACFGYRKWIRLMRSGV